MVTSEDVALGALSPCRLSYRPRPCRGSLLNRWLVAAASVIMMAGLGSFNAWSVFRRPLSELYGANVTDVNTAFFFSSLVFGLVACGSALLAGRTGPRLVGVTGALLYGFGVFFSSFAGGSLPLLYLTYGLVAAFGLGLAVMAPIAALPSWFPERPGFAYGIAFIGFGMGPLINVPLMEGLLSVMGGPLKTFYVLGIIYAAIIGGAARFVRYAPREAGLAERSPGADSEKGGGAWRLSDALKTWQLYALWAVFFLNTTAGLAILSEARVLAGSIGGASAALAAAFIMIISASDAMGRLLWPALSDRIGGRAVFLAMFCLQAAAFSLMPTLAVGSLAILCALCMVVMSCYGGGYGTILTLVGSYYGARGVGAVYASVFSAAALASFGAPVILARSVDLLGSYYPALWATAALMVAGAIIAPLVGPPDAWREREE
jgi:OFA family oxalate/formate antiporter-like MFS transporter